MSLAVTVAELALEVWAAAALTPTGATGCYITLIGHEEEDGHVQEPRSSSTAGRVRRAQEKGGSRPLAVAFTASPVSSSSIRVGA